MEQEFAESTIDATVWLICFHPERLNAWLAKHPPGDVLSSIARARIEKKQSDGG